MENKKPVYKFIEEEGVNDITPVKRKIAKTMEVTENFTFYDVLAYTMKMEKAIKDKEAELEGLKSMLKAYQDEIELIERELDVTEEDKKWNIELHEKLKAEEESKVEEKEEVECDENCECHEETK